MIKTTLVAVAAIGALALPAQAQTGKSAQSIAQCMVANTTPQHEDKVRVMMIKALEKTTPKEEMRQTVMSVGFMMMDLGMSKCGMTSQEVGGPLFQEASGLYGEYLGEKIMGEALAGMQ